MESALFAGVFALPWWGNVAAALLLTHVTIVYNRKEKERRA